MNRLDDSCLDPGSLGGPAACHEEHPFNHPSGSRPCPMHQACGWAGPQSFAAKNPEKRLYHSCVHMGGYKFATVPATGTSGLGDSQYGRIAASSSEKLTYVKKGGGSVQSISCVQQDVRWLAAAAELSKCFFDEKVAVVFHHVIGCFAELGAGGAHGENARFAPSEFAVVVLADGVAI